MKATADLYFAGDCAEALGARQSRDAIGADIRALVWFGDMPGAPSDAQDKVMHAELGIGDSTIFASDRQAIERSSGGYAISLLAADDAEAERLFAALATEGKVSVPLMTTPFASRFAMTTDKYRTPWIVTTPPAVFG
jgi:PhnB protein